MKKHLISSLFFAGASLLSAAANAEVINIDQLVTVPLTFSGNLLESYFNINPVSATFQAGDTVVLNYRFGPGYTGHVDNPALVLAEAWDSAFSGQLTSSATRIDFIGTNNASILHAASGGAINTRLAGQFEGLTAGTYAFNSIRVQFDVAALSSSGYAPHLGYFALVGENISFSTTPASPVPEPESYALLLAGLSVLGWRARRKAVAVKLC